MQTLWIWWPKLGFRVYAKGEFPPDWQESTRDAYIELHNLDPAFDKALQKHLCLAFHGAQYNSERAWQPATAEHTYAEAFAAPDFLSALDILQSFWRTGA